MSELESVDVVMLRTTKARQHHKSRGNVLMYILSSYRSGFLLNKLAHLVSKTKMLFSHAILRLNISHHDNSTNKLQRKQLLSLPIHTASHYLQYYISKYFGLAVQHHLQSRMSAIVLKQYCRLFLTYEVLNLKRQLISKICCWQKHIHSKYVMRQHAPTKHNCEEMDIYFRNKWVIGSCVDQTSIKRSKLTL